MTLNPSNTLVVFALRSESKELFNDFPLLYCGVGKVNAAYRLTDALRAWQRDRGTLPELVLNLGSAGSPVFRKGEIVNCTQFIQRDFDITALGCAPYATPFEDHLPITLSHGVVLNESFLKGICATGDSFVSEGATGPWDVVDMEAYALAKICLLENIPFGCLKYISDGADGHAAGTWMESLDVTAQSLREAVNPLCA